MTEQELQCRAEQQLADLKATLALLDQVRGRRSTRPRLRVVQGGAP